MVVGGRGGIGRAVAARFLREGSTVYSADFSPDGPGHGGGGRFLWMDVTSEDEVTAALDIVRQEAGQLDVLVNAAGVEIEKTIEDTSWRSGTAASRST